MKITMSNSNTSTHIKLQGAIDHRDIEELKNKFLKAQDVKELSLDVSEIQDFDFFFFQLFFSLLKTVKKNKVLLTIHCREQSVFKSILADYGIDNAKIENYCHFAKDLSHD